MIAASLRVPAPVPFRPADRVVLGYLALLNAGLLFYRPEGVWLRFFVIHSLMAIAIVALLGIAARRRSGWAQILADWYPLACFLFFFEEVESLVHFIQPGWFDSWLIAADRWMFGVDPTVWLEQFSRPWLTEIMQASYFSYFWILPLVAGVLYYRGRFKEFELLMTTAVVAYTFCYVVFYLFPIEGPYHTLAHLQTMELDGGFFTRLMDTVERYGRVHGGAFPSAHVVGTVVPWLIAWAFVRPLAWWLSPLVIGILMATVYGRYHYAIDVVAGIIVALGAFLIVTRSRRLTIDN